MSKSRAATARDFILRPAKGGKPATLRNAKTGEAVQEKKAQGVQVAEVCAMWDGETSKGSSFLKVELTPDAAQWVEAAVASGRFPTAEDAVRYAINRARRAELREMLEATEAEGGSFTTEDARRHVREHLDQLKQTSSAS
jgi:Arc/MetJ-type ribon-helix-helix transcriptional regulator